MTAKTEEVLIDTGTVKVRVIALPPGEAGAPHHHTEVTDHMVGVSGEIVIHLKEPDERITLIPGGRCRIEPGRVHQVSNVLEAEWSEYLLIQGVGDYDFIRDFS